ncbi:Dolichol kinase [Geosmithia morbida]|uniref:dolichol kinase n=1 Tax=Geosmithia morbida TaxID=1094350 RepID=A0A9P4YQ88_9HYPO|nr:Dolichol kinase [Geosmithia morbida]KAF4120582.1 Dolichol kinase [Geosmithia morbida]
MSQPSQNEGQSQSQGQDQSLPPDPSPPLLNPDDQDYLRGTWNRSPHPYHHASPGIPHASDRLNPTTSSSPPHQHPTSIEFTKPSAPSNNHRLNIKDSSPASESGTEADDEHFLKGLPASRTKLHKGLRSRAGEYLSRSPSPLPSPSAADGHGSGLAGGRARSRNSRGHGGRGSLLTMLRRHKALSQRAAELANVVALGLMVRSNRQVAPLLTVWGRDYELLSLMYAGLLALYPLRVIVWAYRRGSPSTAVPLRIPPDADPAPILYPPVITSFVSLLVATDNPAVILPNVVLSICSFPQSLVPRFELDTYHSVHWALSCLPLVWAGAASQHRSAHAVASTAHAYLTDEDMTLLYPLHQTLCAVLHRLTTTSLLTAELQLFSVSLVNLLTLASSPQAKVLKSLLWMGGMGILVLCGPVIRAGIDLARVPKWRFRRVSAHRKQLPVWKELVREFSWKRIKSGLFSSGDDPYSDVPDESPASSDSNSNGDGPRGPRRRPSSSRGPKRVQTTGTAGLESDATKSLQRESWPSEPSSLPRSQTLSYTSQHHRRGSRTPSGRRRRAMSSSLRPIVKLTYTQATIRKWLYALYVYAVMIFVILAGVRTHMEVAAFRGRDPIGWGLGYMLGDLSWFRFEVVGANLERWICLPSRARKQECRMGWVQHLRQDDFGEANTRLLVSGYWICVLVVGLLTVFRLGTVYEVDTRRKVFHFTMVGMLLPATFVDPAFAALALSLALAVFLLLDLLRASQLPPLSKPIASFLAPYVDGRDFRGPVVISHIFLLVGCAVPLWLALATLPRSGAGCSRGWELPSREVSMVSGVVCVGLGDAAASLIGRRYGHRKWLWGGGKSLEGSLAFALAVAAGLAFARAWLALGAWPASQTQTATQDALDTGRNVAACASMASLTEAVLTGGNDNVIVPVVLWTCVKSLAI